MMIFYALVLKYKSIYGEIKCALQILNDMRFSKTGMLRI